MDNNIGTFMLNIGGKRVAGEGNENGITFSVHYSGEPVVLSMNDSMARGLAEALITMTSELEPPQGRRRYVKVHGATCFVEAVGVAGARLCLVLNGMGNRGSSADTERELLRLNALSASAIGYSLEALINGSIDFTDTNERGRLRLV